MLSPDTRHDPHTAARTDGAGWEARHCRDVDPEIFFPTAESGHLRDAEIARAKAVCAGCPVIQECREFARERLPYGIAGGLTPAERRAGLSTAKRRVLRAPGDGRRSSGADAGRAALRAGCTHAEVAREFGVSERTVCRWATADRDTAPTDTSSTTTGIPTTGSRATAGRGVA